MNWKQVIDKEEAAAREAARLRKKRAAALAGDGTPGAPLIGARAEATHVRISVATAATHVLVAGVSSRRIAVYELMLWNVADNALELFDGTDSLTGPLNSFPKQFGIYLPNVGEPHFKLAAGNSLQLTLSAAAQVSGYVLYRMEEV